MDNRAAQSRWVVVRTGPTGRTTVTVSAERPAGITIVECDAGQCEADVTANVSIASDSVSDEAIKLEVAKLAYQEHWLTLGFARQMLAAAGAEQDPVAVSVPTPQDAQRLIHALKALLAGTKPVSGWKRQMALSWLRAAIPALAAIPGPTWLVARLGGSTRVPTTASAQVWHAVHGERETRTRHLLPPAYNPQIDTAYLVLGRPRDQLDGVRRIIDPGDALAHVELLRPLNISACLRSLPRAAARVVKLLSVLSRSPIRMSFRDVTALSFRLVQGEAHRAWWERLKTPPAQVIFAHTGTADTTALERAIQARGGKTHHIAHGVNTGWPFTAVSSRATFVCGHDAAFARRLPAYGETHHRPMAPPALRPGDGRWLVLTAYTHPMGRAYACFGIKPDIDALEAVAAAARRCGVPADQIVWRPHPAIAKVAANDRGAVEKRAAALGFARWPQDEAFALLAKYSVVVSTPSTALLDALILGKLPILLVTAPIQSDLCYANYPLCVSGAEDLAAAAAKTDNDAFRSAWNAISPGAPTLSPQDLTDHAADQSI